MTYVVTESCIRCRYTDFVDVCPAGSFLFHYPQRSTKQCKT